MDPKTTFVPCVEREKYGIVGKFGDGFEEKVAYQRRLESSGVSDMKIE